MLHQIFSNKSRPLYRSCELMKLQRISFPTYAAILVARAKKEWGKADEAMIHGILNVMQGHPYYVNALG